MATEYRLPFTAKEIEEKLNKIDNYCTEIEVDEKLENKKPKDLVANITVKGNWEYTCDVSFVDLWNAYENGRDVIINLPNATIYGLRAYFNKDKPISSTEKIDCINFGYTISNLVYEFTMKSDESISMTYTTLITNDKIKIKQETGTSESYLMSQRAITDAIELKANEVTEYVDVAIIEKQDKNFIITLISTTAEDGTTTYSVDKTFEEIAEAYNKGANLYLTGISAVTYMPLYKSYYPSNFRFAYYEGMSMQYYQIVINSNNTVNYTSGIRYASKGMYGGVRAEGVTETDTVEAKIGSDGKLYVPAYPITDTEISAESENPVQNKVIKEYVDNKVNSTKIHVQDAEVGQMLIVKEVDQDGKPTKWECVDRTHYSEGGGEVVELVNETVEYTGDDGYLVTTPFELVVGETYTVSYDDTEHECVCWQYSNGEITCLILGNGLGLDLEDTGEPFVIAKFVDMGITVFMPYEYIDAEEYPNTIHLVVSGKTKETIKKLDNKYLDMEWIPKKKEVLLLDEVVLSNTTADGNGTYANTEDLTISDVINRNGEKLVVYYDGKRYETVIRVFNESGYIEDAMVFAGNMSILGGENFPNTGEPFVLGFGGAYTQITSKEAGEHTISVYEFVPNPMPEEFLPEHIHDWSDLKEKYEEVLQNQTVACELSVTNGFVGVLTSVIPLTLGKKMKIIFSGMEYIDVVHLNDNGQYLYVGNGCFGEIGGADTGEPFCFATSNFGDGDDVSGLYATTNGNHTIVLYENVVNKLPEEFLPESVATKEEISKLSEEISDLKENGTGSSSGGASVDSSLFETVPQNNLFDAENLVTSFVSKDGNTVNGTFTNYIKIDLNKRYVTNLNYTQFYFFDENKVHLSTATYLANPQIITGNGGYLLIKLGSDYSNALVLEGTDIEAYHESYTKLKNDFNKWFGKKWLCIGDSISTDEASLAKDGYAKLISRELGMVLTNIAVSGKVMKDGYEWLDGCSEEYDLITVMLGTNNQGYNCALGSLNDEYYTAGTYNSNNSFYAQAQLMYEKLHEKYPKSIIMFLTPIKRTAVGESANNNDAGYQINALALTTEAYRDVIIDVCDYYSIPCIDLFNCINPRTETDRTLYFMSATDGTHPNDLGHALFLAPVIKDAIEKQAPYYFNDWSDNSDEESGGENGDDTEEPTETTYTITRNLTGCTSSSDITTITEGKSHSETLTASEGYTLEGATVSVTMGGTDISSSYNGGTLTIGSVTGNIVIIVTASVESTEEDTTPVLVHSYSGTPVEFTENDATYTMLEDLTNNLDLNSRDYYKNVLGATLLGHTYGTDRTVDSWVLDRDISFSIKMVNVFRTSMYFSDLTYFNTGSIGGLNIEANIKTTDGRFMLRLLNLDGASATFGDACICLTYITDDEVGSQLTLKSDSNYLFKNNETHDITLTFDATSKNVKIYQDTELVLDEIIGNNLNIDGVNVKVNDKSSFERLEIYKGIIEVA